MEGREENPVPKPHTEKEKLTPHCDQQQEQQQQLGLTFHPLSSVDPDSKLDWILPVLHQETTNEEIFNQEHQKLQLSSEDIQNHLKSLVSEQNGEASYEYVDHEGDDDEFSNQKTLNEELQYQQAVEEGIQDLVLEEKRNETDDDNKDGEGIGYHNRSNHDEEDNYDKSEIEKQDDGAGFVEGETGLMSGWNDGRYRRSPYPVRPDAEDCSFYMRMGACKFGSCCKFNHPFRRKNPAAREKVKEKEESRETLGQVECKYYLGSGGCKYGNACRFKHSIQKTRVVPTVELNFLSLPIRPGEMECSFYMRHGSCKYGSNCRFNHPDPTGVVGNDPLSGYGSGGSFPLQGSCVSTMSPWSSPRALNETTGSFVPMLFPQTQAVPYPYPERNGSQWLGEDHAWRAPSERSLPTPPAFSLNTPDEINFYTFHKHPMLIDEFPERPGQPECSYFMKTGDCKFKSGCKFHHPKNRLLKTTTAPFVPTLNDNGLPQRPDQNICSHYNRYGICKFGPACKFDHPMNYGHSASCSPGFVAPANSSSFGNSATVDDGWE